MSEGTGLEMGWMNEWKTLVILREPPTPRYTTSCTVPIIRTTIAAVTSAGGRRYGTIFMIGSSQAGGHGRANQIPDSLGDRSLTEAMDPVFRNRVMQGNVTV